MGIKVLVGGAVLLLWAGMAPASAQQPSTFDYTIETLRQSVASLVKENQAIDLQSRAMRAKIKELNDELRAGEAETLRLEAGKTAEALKGQRRMSGVEALKAQITQADEAMGKTRDAIEAQRAQLEAAGAQERALQQKADALSAQVAAMTTPGQAYEATHPEFAALQSQRDQLQQQFYDAANKLQVARQRWETVNALVTAGPGQVDVLKAEQADLEKAVRSADAEQARITARLAEARSALEKMSAEDYSDLRAGRLDSEVRDMGERNRKLEAEIASILRTREEKAARAADEREASRKQYAGRFAELSDKNGSLRKELGLLRQKMVSLDKKKVSLEAGIYTGP